MGPAVHGLLAAWWRTRVFACLPGSLPPHCALALPPHLPPARNTTHPTPYPSPRSPPAHQAGHPGVLRLAVRRRGRGAGNGQWRHGPRAGGPLLGVVSCCGEAVSHSLFFPDAPRSRPAPLSSICHPPATHLAHSLPLPPPCSLLPAGAAAEPEPGQGRRAAPAGRQPAGPPRAPRLLHQPRPGGRRWAGGGTADCIAVGGVRVAFGREPQPPGHAGWEPHACPRLVSDPQASPC